MSVGGAICSRVSVSRRAVTFSRRDSKGHGCAWLQDLTSRYNVKDMLPKLKEFSHEWEEDVQVGSHGLPATLHFIPV
jgi:hypothetical protein